MKTPRKTIIICSLLCLFVVQGFGQRGREVMFTHFMVNSQAINPAYVGGREAMTLTSLNRSQWTMLFDKPPALQSFSMHTPARRTPMGFGVAFQNERIGPERITTVEGDIAYTVPVSRHSTLSFGIKGGISMFYVPLTSLIIDDPSDPLFASDIESLWLPNFGFGMYYRSEHLYVGVSIPKLLRTNPFTNQLYAGAKPALTERTYYLIAGGFLSINVDIDILPSAIFRYLPGGEYSAGVGTNVMFYDKFMLGGAYRYNDAMGFMAGVYIYNNLMVSYSFDWGIKDPAHNYNSGTHEIMLRYDLFFLDSHKERTKRPF